MWDTNDLVNDPSARTQFFDNLQKSYSWSEISWESDIAELLSVESSSSSVASNYVATALNNSLKTKIPVVAVIQESVELTWNTDFDNFDWELITIQSNIWDVNFDYDDISTYLYTYELADWETIWFNYDGQYLDMNSYWWNNEYFEEDFKDENTYWPEIFYDGKVEIYVILLDAQDIKIKILSEEIVIVPNCIGDIHGDFVFDLDTNTITDYIWTETDIVIPWNICWEDVINIWQNAFNSNDLTSVIIPNSVISIWQGAFYSNDLASVIIPNSVINIWTNAFSYNELTSVTISNNLTSIGWYIFNNNELTNIIIPNSVESIWWNAFENNKLTSVTLWNGVTHIWTHSFNNNELTNVIIPNNVTFIAQWAFSNNKLTGITIPSSVTDIRSDAFEYNNMTPENIIFNCVSLPALWSGDIFEHNGPNNLTNIPNPTSCTP